MARPTDRTREVGWLGADCVSVTRPPFLTNFSLVVPDLRGLGELRSANQTSFQARLPIFLQICRLMLPYLANETGSDMFRAGSPPECREDVPTEL